MDSKVYLVMLSTEYETTVDSVWSSDVKAKFRAAAKSTIVDEWRVVPFELDPPTTVDEG